MQLKTWCTGLNSSKLLMPPQDSKHYHVPFGKYANFCKSSRRCRHQDATKIPEIPPRHALFLQLLACLARHPSAFTSMCGTDTEGRGALEPPPEGRGARTKLYSTENSSSANRILRPRQKTPDQIPDTKKMILFIHLLSRKPFSK